MSNHPNDSDSPQTADCPSATCSASSEPDLGEWLGPVAVKTLEDAALGIHQGLRWHMLSGITEGVAYFEVLAATCIDGIGVMVRWVKEDGEWTAEAMDSECGTWEIVEEYNPDEGKVIPMQPPPVWDDRDRDSRQNARREAQPPEQP